MYKITIEETKTIKTVVNPEWAKVGEKEVEREHRFLDDKQPKTRIEAVMGYTPEIEKYVQVKRECLVQVVDELDLQKVIKAINNIE